jgi:hypothetical protein
LGVDPVGREELGLLVLAESDGPFALVEKPVVEPGEQDRVVEAGGPPSIQGADPADQRDDCLRAEAAEAAEDSSGEYRGGVRAARTGCVRR